jgi:hypothetical protein
MAQMTEDNADGDATTQMMGNDTDNNKAPQRRQLCDVTTSRK